MLDELKKRLYKTEEDFKERKRKDPHFQSGEPNISHEWNSHDFQSSEEIIGQSKEILKEMKRKKRIRNFIIFTFSFVVVLTAALFLAYKYYIKGGGLGFLSMENIEIKIDSPENANAGERFYFPVVIKNNNKIDLLDMEITAEYPKGSEPVNKDDSTLLKEKRFVKFVPANSELKETFEAFIFGEENSEQDFKITIEYRIKDSSAIFEKTYNKKILITKPAISILIDAPQEASFGKEINLKVEAISNSSAILKNIFLNAEYPSGFEFKESDPAPQEGNFKWILGDLMPGEKKIITIKGVAPLKGPATEGTITIFAATSNEDGEQIIYSRKSQSFGIKKPFLDVSIEANNKSGEYAIQSGEKINAKIFWENNLPIGINNAIIEARIKEGGEIIDLSSIDIKNGNYRSFDNVIIWDSSTFNKFSFVEPGQKGEVNFSFKIKKNLLANSESVKNLKIILEAKFLTSNIPDEYKNIEISGNSNVVIKIVSDFQFAQKGFYSLGAFKNTGPIPPKVGKETTYTIKWSLVNSYNDLQNVSVFATLPNYVKWLNNTHSASKIGQLFYNEETRQVKWIINKLKSGTGISSPAEEISFQILLLPAEAHLKTAPVLISNANAESYDAFVGADLKDSDELITTELPDDPRIKYGDGTVVE